MTSKVSTRRTKKDGKGDQYGHDAELARIQSTDPRVWSVSEVARWLDLIELSEHKKRFIENAISGEELLELSTKDMTDLGITSLGHKKKLSRKIKHLTSSSDAAFDANSVDADSNADSEDKSSVSSSGKSGSSSGKSGKSGGKPTRAPKKDPPTTLVVKCNYKNEWIIFKLKRTTTLTKLRKQIRKETKQTMELRYKDDDGDFITIKKQSHLKTAIEDCDGPLKLYLKPKEAEATASITLRERETYEGLTDAVAVIDPVGTLILFNAAAQRLFGYSLAEVLAKNVKMLMPPSTAESHDFYLWRYMKDKVPHIIGVQGRKVIAAHKEGRTFPILLTVTEGKGTFTGVFKDLRATDSSANLQFSLLKSILHVAIVINELGIILFVNDRAVEVLGFTSDDLIGKNVNLIMPEPYKSEHDGYLKNYRITNNAKIIGTGREVVARQKDGTIIPVHLSISESNDSFGRYFTGLLEPIQSKIVDEKSFLVQKKALLSNLLVPGVLMDEKGVVLFVNKPAVELTGYSSDEAVGKNVNIFIPSPEKEKHDSYLRRYLRTGKAKVIGVGRDVIAEHRDGSNFPVHLSVVEKVDAVTGRKYFTGLLQKI